MPNIGDSKKRGRSHIPYTRDKQPKEDKRLNNKDFKWSFDKCIWSHDGWVKGCSGVQFFAENIVAKLKHFETMKWQEILNASGGNAHGNGNNNHFILGNKLPKNEQSVFIKLGYFDKYEKVFSLRLSGQEHLIGIVDENVLYVLWYDFEHKFF